MSTSPTLADAADRRTDNFLPLRHLAARLVIYGHSYPLGNNVLEQKDLLHAWLPSYSISRCAVFLFFAISGYLLTSSLLRHPSVLRYAWRWAHGSPVGRWPTISMRPKPGNICGTT